MKTKVKESKTILYRDTSLMLAMFFLPFGYDALFKLLMEVTGSYWVADMIFYLISGCFWLSYIFFSRKISSSNEV